MKCVQCHKTSPDGSTECEHCGVVFVHLDRQGQQKPKGPELCTAGCGERAVINGQCREHAGMRGCVGNRMPVNNASMADWGVRLLAFRKTNGKGEYPLPPQSAGAGTRRWHAAMADWLASGRASIYVGGQRTGLPQPQQPTREPGMDC